MTQKPFICVALADSMPLYRAEASRRVAEAYLALLEAEGGRLPPKRRLDVTQLASAIPHLVLAAVTKPDRCIYRVAGETVKDRVGRNPVGLNYYDFVPAERRAHAMRAMNMVIDRPCAFRAELEQSYSGGLSQRVEAVAFPLGSEQPDIDGFILFAESEIAGGVGKADPRALLLGTNVLRRDLIDIGFGVDDVFEDLIPAAD